jgi:hypothetical protein
MYEFRVRLIHALVQRAFVRVCVYVYAYVYVWLSLSRYGMLLKHVLALTKSMSTN